MRVVNGILGALRVGGEHSPATFERPSVPLQFASETVRMVARTVDPIIPNANLVVEMGDSYRVSRRAENSTTASENVTITTKFKGTNVTHNISKPGSVSMSTTLNLTNSNQNASHHLDSKVAHNDPYESWSKHKIISPLEYWEASKENVKDSNAFDLVTSFVRDYQDNDTMKCKAKGLGIVPCFQWIYAGVSDFHCTIGNQHMCKVRSPEEIAYHVDLHWPHKSIKERVNLARQIHFVNNNIHKTLVAQKEFHDLTTFVEIYAVSLVADMVKCFTHQVDGVRVRHCEIAKELIKFLYDLGIVVATDLGSVFIPEMSGMIMRKAGEQVFDGTMGKKFQELAWKHSKNIAFNNVPKGGREKDRGARLHRWGALMGHLQTSNDHLSWTGKFKEHSSAFQFDSTKSGKDVAKEYKEHELPMLKLIMTKSNKLCGNKFGVINDDNISHESQLKDWIGDFFTEMRSITSDNFNDWFTTEKESSAEEFLRKFLAVGELDNRDILNGDLKAKIINLKQVYTELVASQLLTGARSYMKCEDRADAQEVCKKLKLSDPKNPHMAESVYCPPDQKNLVCIVASFSKQEKNNHEVFIPGLDGGLEKYNMTAKMVAENSLSYFRTNRGNEYEHSTPLSDEKKPHHMLHIPVCISKNRMIETIRGPSFNENLYWTNAFPFQCGDHRSNETASFLASTNIDPTQEETLWTSTLAKNLKRNKMPANRYILLCELGVRWPMWSKSTNRFDVADKLVPDSHDLQCANFMLQAQSMSEFEMNAHFCTDPKMVQQMRREHPWLINANAISHKRMCRKFVRRNKKAVIKAVGGTKQKAKEIDDAIRELEAAEDAELAELASQEADKADDAEWKEENTLSRVAKRWIDGVDEDYS